MFRNWCPAPIVRVRVMVALASLWVAASDFAVAQETNSAQAVEQRGTPLESPLAVEQWPAGVTPRQGLPSARSLDYEFEDVDVEDIEGWLNWFGVELPVAADGKLSGWVWGQRGTSGWFTFSDYRVEGEIRSPNLQLDRWQVENAALRFGYASGNWYVGQLTGTVRAEESDAVIGQANLAARIPTDPAAGLATEGVLEQVDLSELLKAFNVDFQLSSGEGNLRFHGTAPLATANDLSRWNMDATLQLEKVAIEGIPEGNLKTSARLADGRWTILRGELNWLDEPIGIEGNGELKDDFPFRLAINASNLSLPHLLNDFGQSEFAAALDGQIQISARTTGTATTGLETATAEIASDQLLVLDQSIRQLLVDLSLNDGSIQLELASAEVAGGRMSGRSDWLFPIEQSGSVPNYVRLQVEQVDLTQLSQKIVPVSLVGTADGEVSFATAASGSSDDRSDWKSSGQFELTNFGGFDSHLGTTQLSWNKQLNASTFLADLATSNGAIALDLTSQLIDDPNSQLQHTAVSSYLASGEVTNFSTRLNLEALGLDLPSFLEMDPAGWSQLPLRTTGSFQVSGTPTNWIDSGRVELARLDTELMQRNLGLRSTILLLDPQELRLQQFQLFDGDGRIAGAAVIRRVPEGNHQLNLRIADVRLEEYVPQFAKIPSLETLSGLASFETRLVNNAADNDLINGWNGSLAASMQDISVQDTPLGSLIMQGNLDNQLLTATFAGKLLNGPATISAEIPRRFIAKQITATQLVSTQVASVGQEEPKEADVPVLDEDEESVRFELSWEGVEIARVVELTRILPLPADTRQWLSQSDFASAGGEVDIKANFQSPKTSSGGWDAWRGDLLASMRDVRYRGLDVGDLTVDGSLKEDLLSLHMDGHVLEGALRFDAQLPRAWLEDDSSTNANNLQSGERADIEADQSTSPSNNQSLELRTSWSPVQLEQLIALIAERPLPDWLQIQIEQYALDTLTGTLLLSANVSRVRPDLEDWLSGWEGELSIDLNDIALRDQPLGSTAWVLTVADEKLSGRVDGQILGGAIIARTDSDMFRLREYLWSEGIAKDEDASARMQQRPDAVLPPRSTYSASLVGIDLKRLMRIASGPRNIQTYAGVATVSTEGEVDEGGALRAELNFSVPVLWQNRTALARQLVGELSYDAGALRVVELRGGVAGGVVEARGMLPLRSLADPNNQSINPIEQLQFAARRIELGELVTFLYPEYGSQFSGKLSYRGRVRFARNINVVGNVRASDALAFGLPIQDGQGGLQMQFNTDGSFDQLKTSNLSGTWIGGNFVGELQLQGGASTALTASGRIGRGKLDQLSRALGFEHVLGTGRFDAVANLQSKDATSIAALIGAVEINFESGDAQSLPILTELGRYVPLLQLASTDITGGTLHGFVGQGQLRIRDFILLGESFWIVGQGNAGLVSNRLDIEAVLETGGGLTDQLAQSAFTRLAVGVLPQAALLAELNTLLSNRSIYFHIGGTTSKPVVQARPAQIIGKALIQNVRRRLLALPTLGLLDEANSGSP